MAIDCLENTIKDYGTDMTTVTKNLYRDLEDLLGWPETPKVPLSFKEDPVTLSCACWRHGSYEDLDQVLTTDQDRDLALKVRSHYLSKLTMQKLKGHSLSQFREKLGAFLVNNRPLYKDEIGMLYQLPYFYHEDLAVDALMSETAPVTVEPPHVKQRTLTPLKTLSLKRRGGEITQFWWTDQENHPYCLSIKTDVEHHALYQSIFDFSSICVETTLYPKPFLGTERYYYKMIKTKLLSVKS